MPHSKTLFKISCYSTKIHNFLKKYQLTLIEMKKQIVIDGFKIYDKTSLYEELNRKLMPDEDWKMGESLDALNDVLYGGFGEIHGKEPIVLTWKNFENNQQLFGFDFTLSFYENKLKFPEQFNLKFIQKSIEELKNGTGKTYFEIILEIIAEHPNIELVRN